MDGLRVGVTAARRGEGLVAALERHGAAVCWAPTLAGDREQSQATASALREVLAHSPQWVVVSTGVGARALLAAAVEAGLDGHLHEVLRRAKVVARGAKAHAALRSINVEPVFVSPQETDRDTAAWLAQRVLCGDVVGVVAHGSDGDGYQAVADAGATVVEVQPYRCAPTTDVGPVTALIARICSNDIDAVLCTSPASLRNLMAIAAQGGRREELSAALRERVAVAAIGPVTAAAAEDAGARVTVMPLRQRTADLVAALDAWSRRGARVVPVPFTLQPATHNVGSPDGVLHLGERQFNLLAALVRRPGVACPPETLAREVWGHTAPADPAAVKHQVSRTRHKLGRFGATIETVRAVGYRYQPAMA